MPNRFLAPIGFSAVLLGGSCFAASDVRLIEAVKDQNRKAIDVPGPSVERPARTLADRHRSYSAADVPRRCPSPSLGRGVTGLCRTHNATREPAARFHPYPAAWKHWAMVVSRGHKIARLQTERYHRTPLTGADFETRVHSFRPRATVEGGHRTKSGRMRQPAGRPLCYASRAQAGGGATRDARRMRCGRGRTP